MAASVARNITLQVVDLSFGDSRAAHPARWLQVRVSNIAGQSSFPASSLSYRSKFGARASSVQETAERVASDVAPLGSPSPFTEYYSEQREWGRSAGKQIGASAILSSLPPPLIRSYCRSQAESSDKRPDGLSGIEQAQPSDRACEDDDIALRLPELREVLNMMKEKQAGGRQKAGPGNVYLVGTGPGDPELLTVKALRLLQSANLVLYDRLVSTDILDMIHPNARLLYVGKTSGYHSRTQEEIHELLLAFAEAGATVVRLKGGDPLVFGRGGEEVDYLQERGIRVQVVPGITAASGIAAELGIPLTHRGVANSVRFLTGHSRKGGEDPLYVAGSAADPDATLVIYMGLATLPGLAAKLMASGLPPSTPAAAIERGTTPDQRTVFAQLQDLPEKVEEANLVSPTLIFIGRVVALSYLWPLRSDESCSNADSREEVNAEGTFREPRDRSLRGADPALPSQLAGAD